MGEIDVGSSESGRKSRNEPRVADFHSVTRRYPIPGAVAHWDPTSERGKALRFDPDEYQKTLGEELRGLRNSWGWTRKELGEQLDSEISLQTLATYELGTRHCSVVRLVELCTAMGEQPHELLSRVHRRMFPAQPGQLRVNLRALTTMEDHELAPLRRWAQGRLQAGTHPDASNDTVLLDAHALHWLAELCGIPTERIHGRLELLAGES